MRRTLTATLQISLLRLIAGYRRWISPVLPPACRFHPTCSEYAAESIQIHGPARGTLLTVRRVCRCHPLSAGGLDPVPPRGETRRSDRCERISSLAVKEVR
ncbi:MAG TPA: membrane protein insertion efficiency factor YidD [Candidatus Krumholzibacteria bacterium]|nr:membrane protein insertion efficiency factor YidD [Candidatus Krumholzibacteria bacterium]